MTKKLLVVLSFLLIATSCEKNLLPKPADDIDYESLKENSIKEFLSFAENPRPSFNVEKPREYLKSVAGDNGWSWERDEYGNCWFDLPATKGFENYPNVILQSHMDMVCASVEGETHDFLKEVGTPLRERNCIRGQHINIGADDGIGVGMILAIAKSNVAHGPLRCLFTADEEPGLFGAANLDPSTLNARYLLSLDEETSGYVDVGSAGAATLIFERVFETTGQRPNQNKISVTISGLRGGHSGYEINNHRLSAGVMMTDMLGSLIDSFEINVISVNSGDVFNAILNSGEFSFAVNSSDTTAAMDILQAAVVSFTKEYPEETIKFGVSCTELSSDDRLCTFDDTKRIHQLLDGLKYGPIEVNGSHVTKSSNIAPVNLNNGDFYAASLMRSDYNEWLDEQVAYYIPFADNLGINGSIYTQVPAWHSANIPPMVKMLEQYYSEAVGGDIVEFQSQAFLEPSYFTMIRPDIETTCIGPQIDEAHTIRETLYTDTLIPVLKATIQTIQHINEL